MNTQEAALLSRIEAFPLDEPGVAFPFSRRLARENGWTHAFALRAIAEYRRFAFLAVCAEHPVTPSEAVDEVWHLHLCYTESYWNHFCANVLGRPLHHGPTKGGLAEQQKHFDWYERTLAAYRRYFNEAPPADLWPDPQSRFRTAARFVRVDARKHWIVSKPEWWPSAAFAAAILAVAALVSGCHSSIIAAIPIFDWSGPAFLWFYSIFVVVVFTLCAFHRRRLRGPGGVPENYHEDPYAAAILSSGMKQAVNAAVLNLVHRGFIHCADGRTLQVPIEATTPAEIHPVEQEIIAAISQASRVEVRSIRSYIPASIHRIEEDLRRNGLLLGRLRAFRAFAEPTFLVGVVFVVGIIKIFIGLARMRPVEYLVMLTMASVVVGLLCFGRSTRRTRRGDAVLRMLRAKYRRKFRTALTHPAAPEQYAFAVGLYGLGAAVATHAAIASQLTPPASIVRGSSGSNGCTSGCGGGSGGGGCSGGSGCGGGGGCGGCGGGH